MTRTWAAHSESCFQHSANSRNLYRASSPSNLSASSQHSRARSSYCSSDRMARTLRPLPVNLIPPKSFRLIHRLNQTTTPAVWLRRRGHLPRLGGSPPRMRQTRNVQWVGQFLCANPTLPLQSGCKIGEDVSSFRFGIVRRWAQAPFRLGCSNRPISRAGMCQPKAEEPPHGSATKRGTDVTTLANSRWRPMPG